MNILDVLEAHLSSRSEFTLRQYLGHNPHEIPPGMFDRVEIVLQDHGWTKLGENRWHHPSTITQTHAGPILNIHRAAEATLKSLEAR